MSPRLRLVALIWLSVAVLLRVYGINGGDNAIVGGLIFLVWTVPFGMIWQFYLYNFALLLVPPSTAQVVGDILVIVIFIVFWFFLVPRTKAYFRERRSKEPE